MEVGEHANVRKTGLEESPQAHICNRPDKSSDSCHEHPQKANDFGHTCHGFGLYVIAERAAPTSGTLCRARLRMVQASGSYRS